MEAGGTKGSDIKAKRGEEEGDFSLDSSRKLCQKRKKPKEKRVSLKKRERVGEEIWT